MRLGRELWRSFVAIAIFAAFAGVTAAVANANPAASKPLPNQTLAAMTGKDVLPGAPVYLRIFKEESELEVWKGRDDGRYLLIKTFPICTWSGSLGPKQTQGDLMSPEGFYDLRPHSMKPDSKYHLALNIGYPNALDRALKRTGNFIMVHGDCVSVGCFAMTDAYIEEIYAFVREAFDAGVPAVPVHIFPFRMTAANMARHAANPAKSTWRPMKEAYDDFAETYEPPRIGVCGKRYVVNPLAPLDGDPEAACPARIGKWLSPVSPSVAIGLMSVDAPIVAAGSKMKSANGNAGVASAPAPQPKKKLASSRDPDLGLLKPLSAR